MVRILIWIGTALVMSLGIFHTFQRWGLSKEKCLNLIGAFIVTFLVISIVLSSSLGPFAFILSLALVGLCFPLPLHRWRIMDGLGAWMPLGLAILLMGNSDTPSLIISEALLIIAFMFLQGVYGPRLYFNFGELWFISLFLCSGILLLTPFNQIISLIFLVISSLGYSWRAFIKKSHEKPLLLFDLDGTLIDSRELVFETFRQVFAKKKPGYPLSQKELYSFFGPTLEESFSRYFPEEEIEEVIDLYQKINMDLHPKFLKTMPHADKVLKELHDQGYSMAIVSNKRKKPVEYGLQLSGLDVYFDQVFAKEDQPASKPNPEGLIYAATTLGYPLDQVVYVGDNVVDIQAARNSAFYSIGYTIDDTQKEALKAEHPCFLVNDLEVIPILLEEEDLWIDKSIW